MEKAFEEIDKSDLLIAELTTKAIGVGIEIGYAFARQKPIVYLRRKDAEYSTTASGCSSYFVAYKDEFDLKKSMKEIISQLL